MNREFLLFLCGKTVWISLIILNPLLAIWTCGAIWFQPLFSAEWLKIAVITGYLCAVAAGLIFSRKIAYLPWCVLGLTVVVISAWLLFMRPTGERDWQISCSRIPRVEFHDAENTVTISDIRDFHYRSTEDFDVNYITRTYRIDELETVDYAIVHWDGMELIGHVILSFGFRNGERLAFSAETRIGKHDSQSLLAGIYRQYEMIFILATEEDVFQLRTNHRHEDVYLYPTNTSHKAAVVLFRDLVRRAADLEKHPRFYNTLLFNCMSSLYPSIRLLEPSFSGKMLMIFNGVSDQAAYRSGWLRGTDKQETFADYKKRHYANQYVDRLKDPADYSLRIRSKF